MTTSQSFKNATGTLNATINNVANFVADEVYFKTAKNRLTIVGADENSAGPLRLIEIAVLADIQNGEHSYPSEQVLALSAGANTAPAHFITEFGTLNVDFDRQNHRYRGHFDFTATNLFRPKNTIKVVGDFDIHANPASKQ